MRPSGEPLPVSVVIPCWRCADTVERAVMSVAGQTRRPTEVILVDDASGDDTLGVLHAVAEQYPRGWITVVALDRNGGPGTARNRGWDAATSPYIAFLDADDAWCPRKLELQYQWMLQHPEAMLTGHDCADAPCAGWSGRDRIFEAHPIFARALLYKNVIVTSSVMIRNDPTLQFAEGKRGSEDFLLWLELAFAGRRLFVLDATLAHFRKARFGAGGLSGALWAMEQDELDTYDRLRRSGKISGLTFIGLALFSLMKFVRRCAIVGMRRCR
jgi:glycosyltransferase involved in cell wall biosynthesis